MALVTICQDNIPEGANAEIVGTIETWDWIAWRQERHSSQ